MSGEFFKQYSTVQVQSSFHQDYPRFKALYEQMFANAKPRSRYDSLHPTKRPPERHPNQQKPVGVIQCNFKVPDSNLKKSESTIEINTLLSEKKRSKADISEADKEDILGYMINANRQCLSIAKPETLSVKSGSIEVCISAASHSHLVTAHQYLLCKSIKRPTLDSTEGWTTGCLGLWMIENSKLVVPTSRALTFADKIFISNLVSPRHKDKIVGVCLDRDDFIATININIGSPILRKSDEQFR